MITSYAHIPGATRTTDHSKPAIMLVRISTNFGGAERHVFELYQRLAAAGYPVTLVVDHCLPLIALLNHAQLPYYLVSVKPITKVSPLIGSYILSRILRKICQEAPPAILHTNGIPEAMAATRVAKKLGCKTVLTIHSDYKKPSKFKKTVAAIDALITVNHDLYKIYTGICTTIPHVQTIIPLFDAPTFNPTIHATTDRSNYFTQTFNLSVGNVPIITKLANFYSDPLIKNHSLLIKAVNILVHDRHLPLHVLLVGGCSSKSAKVHQQAAHHLVHDLKLEHVVSFIGFTHDTMQLFQHSDIVLLASTRETVGLVLAEAALLERPTIAPSRTGAAYVVEHEKTGLVFENGNEQDLADKIEQLIKNPVWAQQLGRNGRQRVLEKFGSEQSFAQHEALYKNLSHTSSVE